jgi:hypothetical protein
MQDYDFSSPDSTEAHQAAHQRRMAEAMMAQATMGNQPAFSNRAALARVLMGGLAGMELGGVQARETALAEKAKASRSAEMNQLADAMETPEGSPDRAKLARLLMQSSNPNAAKAGLALLTRAPTKLERVDLGDRIGMIDERGTIVREVPKGVSPDTRFSRETVSADTQLTHGTPSATAKLTDERTRQEGALNRGVQIQGQRLTDERAREGNAIAAGGKVREDLDGLRKEFDSLPEVKTYKEAAPVLASAKKAPDTPAGDLSLVYAVGKVLDPNSVVREGEMTLVVKSGSVLERMIGAGRVNFGKGRLTPEMRANLTGMLDQRVAEYEKNFGAAKSKYEGIAKQRGYDPSQIFTGMPKTVVRTGKVDGRKVVQYSDGSIEYAD